MQVLAVPVQASAITKSKKKNINHILQEFALKIIQRLRDRSLRILQLLLQVQQKVVLLPVAFSFQPAHPFSDCSFCLSVSDLRQL